MKFNGRVGRPLSAGLATIAAACLAGCGDRAPSGQVVATVAGVDITRRDLAVEAALRRQGPVPAAALRGAMLADLVDRQLLARRAEREGLDRTPEYLAALRRNRELLLASLAAQQIAASLPEPSPGEVRAYLDRHRPHFADRQLFLLRRPAEATDAGQWVDGAELPAAALRAIAALPPGRTAAVPSIAEGSLVVARRRAAPIVGEAAQRQAAAAIRQARLGQRIAAVIAQEQAQTRVRYQVGFGPAAGDPQ